MNDVYLLSEDERQRKRKGKREIFPDFYLKFNDI